MLNRKLCVHVAFGSLIQVQILGITASGSNYYISQLLDVYACHSQQILTALLPCLVPVACNNLADFSVRSKYSVHQKIRLQQLAGFIHILMNGIALEQTCVTGLVAACAFYRGHSHAMVLHDAFVCCYARHNSLASAAEAGKGMQRYGTGQNNSVGIGNIFADSNIIAEGGLAKQYHVLALAGVMLNNFQTAHHILAANGDILFMRMTAVGTGSNNNSDVLVLYAHTVQLGHNNRQKFGRAAQTGDIADDNGYSFACMHNFAQRLGTDRVTDCFGISGNNVLADAGFIAVYIIYNALLGEQYLFLSFAYWQKVLFHRHPSI